MRKCSVSFEETFLLDLTEICLYIMEKSGSVETAQRFYTDVLASIEHRSFAADSYEPFYPYSGSPKYFRLYFGNYTIFYVVENGIMEVRRMLWSGAKTSDKL